MKTILVDAWNTLVTENGINTEMKILLDTFENNKLIVTNANQEEQIKFGIVNMPYEVFSLAHLPNKTDSNYFVKLLEVYSLKTENVIYFEHNPEAVLAAESLGIKSFLYQSNEGLNKLKEFLTTNL